MAKQIVLDRSESLALEHPAEVSKLAYAIGYAGISLITQVITMWALFFYAPPAGEGVAYVPVHLAGIAFAISRIIDSGSDIIIGVVSDRTRSRWGRRRPYIILGALPLAASFALIWTPPVAGVSIVNFFYLSIVLVFFFALYTVVIGPYLALLPEIAPSRSERISVATWQAVFNVAGLMVAVLGSSLIIERAGFRVMGFIVAALALVIFLIPGIMVKERIAISDEERPGFLECCVAVFRNRPFRVYMLSKLLIWFGFNMIIVGIAYIVTVVMDLPKEMAGYVMVAPLAIAVIFFRPIGYIAERTGKKRTLVACSLLLAAAMALIPLIGRLPLPLGPAAQGFIILCLVGAPASALLVLPNALIADICDHGLATNGLRLEGAYFGVQGFLNKVGMGLSSLAVAYLLNYFGYSTTDNLGVILIGPIAALFVVAGVIGLRSYELD